MIAVSKSRLKAKLLEYFRHVEETGEELIVTSHGTPTLKIVPFAPKVTPETAFGQIRERATVYGDLMEPEAEEWGDV